MTVKKVIIGLLSVLVLALLMTPSLVAQSLVSGDLTGTVTDPSGAVVPNATVSLKNNGTGATRHHFNEQRLVSLLAVAARHLYRKRIRERFQQG